MDLEYLDPFNTAFPQNIENILNDDGSHGNLCCIEFSPSGFWLATGTEDGQVLIWDMSTNSIIHAVPKPVELHEVSVYSISWCIDRKTLLISYNDGHIYEWDISKKSYEQDIKSEIRLVNCSYNREGQWIVVQEHSVKLVDGLMTLHEYKVDDKITCASISAGSSTVFLGTSKGSVVSLDASDLSVNEVSFDPGSSITNISAHHHESNIICTISKDRAVRVYRNASGDKFELGHKFFDVIERSGWTAAGFNHDGEYAFGAIRSKGVHLVHIWELQNGTIIGSLEGPREDIIDVKWHPRRPIVVTLSKFGKCFFWKPQYPKKWSALFPGMTEVEENVEYIEREDEFDEIQEKQAEEVVVEEEIVDLSEPLHSISSNDLIEVKLFV